MPNKPHKRESMNIYWIQLDEIMPKRYLIKQNKPWFIYNHDNNVDFLADVYHVYWSLENEKNRVAWENKKTKKCQIYKAEFDISKVENLGP